MIVFFTNSAVAASPFSASFIFSSSPPKACLNDSLLSALFLLLAESPVPPDIKKSCIPPVVVAVPVPTLYC